ncbi:GntR family transcriptional regulator [Rheinheimera mangrovi]|uniref:GntR family transcriptional regulator n=1 Tax=Rheinheimera mangrovi TaxID=2498451 RepID=UPI000F8E6ECE|nr:GntR family transcriptional regulator [Rheinheimera mangrovi]
MAKYRALAQQLTEDILSGLFPLGAVLPTERELCLRWQISRHTAREALRSVERVGLVSRRQGSGTVVVRTSLPERINQFVSSVQDVLQFGQQTRFRLEQCELIQADTGLAELLGTTEGTACVYLGGVRTDPYSNAAICYTQIYRIDQQDATTEALKNSSTAVQTMVNILQASRIGKVEQQLSASLMDKSYAKALRVEENSAAMRISRRYFDKNQQLILVAQSVYPAHRYSYSHVLLPQ